MQKRIVAIQGGVSKQFFEPCALPRLPANRRFVGRVRALLDHTPAQYRSVCVPRYAGRLLPREKCYRMPVTSENVEVKSFFSGYETANAIFDLERIAACYADVFMFGGPEGVQCVKKDEFLKVLPRRKEFFRSQGLTSSKIDSFEATALDSKYTFVKVIWNMRFEVGAGEPKYSRNAASYVLSRTDNRFQIIFQIDHQDLRKSAGTGA